jgi:hypothetical protein
MTLWGRRGVLIAGAAGLASVATLGRRARADVIDDRNGLWFSGHETQGGLVLGRAPDGSQIWVDNAPVRIQDGFFCFGFGRDDTKSVAVRCEYPDGRSETKTVSPTKRSFEVQSINGLPEEYVSPPAEVQGRITREAQAVADARNTDSGELWFAEQFDWPAKGIISSVYGSQRILNGEPKAPHYGVDIAAAEGTPIRAPNDGVVTMADNLYLSGNTLILDHGHGVSTSYLHMSKFNVQKGDRVDRGDVVGAIGQTGRATGPHVCWRMNWFQTRLDVALVAPSRPPDKS